MKKLLLRDKVAIVTGAARGIGRAIALAFAQEGAKVVVSDVDPNIEGVVNEIKKLGRDAIAVQADVSNVAEVKLMIKKTLNMFGRVDILVNNAGINIYKSIEDTTEEDFYKILNVNLKGVFLCTKEIIELMKAQGSGKIINIASTSAMIGSPVSSPFYVASKGAVIALTRTLAKQLGCYGINVNAIAPGYTDTKMTDNLPREVREAYVQQTPLGRVGTPEDVAKVAVFLASDYANFVTGETVVVSGGQVMS